MIERFKYVVTLTSVVHIEKRKIGKAIKYFLSYSYREGGSVYKLRKYLGQDLTAKLLKERKVIAEKLILKEINRYSILKDPLQVELSSKEIKAIKKIQAKIPLKVHPLSEREWEEFSRIFTYNTNAIEGSRLNLIEVKDLLEKDQWPDKSKEDIAEAYGVDEALRFIRKTTEHISVDLIKKIHKIVFKNSKPFAGKLRKNGEEVVVMGGGGTIVHEGAPQSKVLHLLKELIEWYSQNKCHYPALILGAVIHNQFENIHPFRDGNGRVGRILLNNILVKRGLPPINIDFKNRGEYYASLQAYEKRQDLRPTINLYLKEYENLKKKLSSIK